MYGTGLLYLLWYCFGLMKALLVCSGRQYGPPILTTSEAHKAQQKTAQLMLAIKYRERTNPDSPDAGCCETARVPVMVPDSILCCQ